MTYAPTIGLEVHLQLKTSSKIFCGCSTAFGASPNSQVCPVCLGLPGVLPVLNRQVLRYGVKVALALHCRIQPRIVLHRKNYFYPDLPKGYQISQYDLPLGSQGFVQTPSGLRVGIHRVHMEEDAGKLIHKTEGKSSLVDLNRAGVPLLEIVSEPDLRSPEQAYEYLKTLKGILEYLDVSDCDMEKGSLRCDANVSILPVPGTGKELGTKVEIKNLNSFRAVARALAYEIQRQGRLLEEGGKVIQETRLWDDMKGMTQGMRSKEYAHDYRYFPEPDLVPFAVSPEEVEEVRQALPELPAARAERLAKEYGIPPADARALTASQATAHYYEASVKLTRPERAKAAANWILGEMAREMNDRNLDEIRDLRFPPEFLVEIMDLIDSGEISGKMAKEVFMECLRSGETPSAVVKSKGLVQVTDREAIRVAGREVIREHTRAMEDFRHGKAQALMFLVGQLMRRMKGAASPGIAQEVLRGLLAEEKNQ